MDKGKFLAMIQETFPDVKLNSNISKANLDKACDNYEKKHSLGKYRQADPAATSSQSMSTESTGPGDNWEQSNNTRSNAMGNYDKHAANVKAERIWGNDSKTRIEFNNDKESFFAYAHAEARGATEHHTKNIDTTKGVVNA